MHTCEQTKNRGRDLCISYDGLAPSVLCGTGVGGEEKRSTKKGVLKFLHLPLNCGCNNSKLENPIHPGVSRSLPPFMASNGSPTHSLNFHSPKCWMAGFPLHSKHPPDWPLGLQENIW